MLLLLIICLSTFTIAWLSSCKVEPSLLLSGRTLKEEILVHHNPDGSYSLDFETEGEWKIYRGNSPDKIDWTEPFSVFTGKTLQLPPASARTRSFFGLVSPKGDTMIVSERKIPLEEQPNFRDLGGLPAGKDRYVKWGMIYRSGKLSDLTRNDQAYLSNLGIRTVVDLRNNIEIGKDPDRLPNGVNYHQFSLSDKEGQAYNRLRRMVLREGYRKQKAKDLFQDVMRAFADTLADDIKPVFELLLKEEKAAPLVFHCSGGKDRTGFTAAMILSALGVDRSVILQDYLMSNFYRQTENASGMSKARLLGIDAETLEYAFLVREEYMKAVFEVIDKKYGGTDKYLETKYGLGEAERQFLREKFTLPYLKVIPVTLDTIELAPVSTK
ncbi:MAG: tyrosine-protein phosphatase [Bacteroidota bacterium]